MHPHQINKQSRYGNICHGALKRTKVLCRSKTLVQTDWQPRIKVPESRASTENSKKALGAFVAPPPPGFTDNKQPGCARGPCEHPYTPRQGALRLGEQSTAQSTGKVFQTLTETKERRGACE
ncbi:unnamed protein product [Arctogadus glacialis]